MAKENMIPYIYDKSFNRIAEIDDYKSFIWTQRYYTPGDFELCAPISKLKYFAIGYYVFRKGDDYGGIIEKVYIGKTEDQSEVVIATGRSLTSILGRRVISTQQMITGSVLSGIELLITDNIVNPDLPARQISNFIFTNTSQSIAEMEAQYIGENLLDVVSGLCESNQIGMKCKLGSSNNFIFELYDGVDKSYAQSVNPYVVWSDKYDNLYSSEYFEDCSEFATDVCVGGEVISNERVLVWSAKDSQSGIERFEKFLDASNTIQNEQIITLEQYKEQLEGLGLVEVTEYTAAFSGEVDFSRIMQGNIVNVGDICTIQNNKWGIYINSRVLEIIESVGEDGSYKAIPTFGS